MASTFIAKSLAISCGAMAAESKYGPRDPGGLVVVTPLILLGTGFWSLLHGMSVGMRRGKIIKAAEEDGEADVEDRYALPNLYAQGTSKHAKTLNALQRSHQHIFETFTQLTTSALVAALEFPITSAVGTLAYAVGRIAMSKSYANSDGDASKRYESPVAFWMWYGLLLNTCTGIGACIKMAMDKKILF